MAVADALNTALFAQIDRALLELRASRARASPPAYDPTNPPALSGDPPPDARPNSGIGVHPLLRSGVSWYSNTTRPIGASGSEDISRDREDHAAFRHVFPRGSSC